MPTPQYHLRCLQNKKIAHNVHEVKLEKPERMTFQPGQFVLFDVPLMTNADDIQPRAFSIASHPSEEDLLFVIRLKEGGRASTWLVEGLQEGDTIRIQGPFGRFQIDPNSSKDLAFLCTGAGLAPFRSMLLAAKERKEMRKMDLIFGVRNEADLFWADELTRLMQEVEGLTVHIALTQPADSWTGHKGRLQHLAPLIIPDIARRQVYVCGNPDMTNEVKKLCLEEWGIEKSDLHVEGYI